MSSFNYRVWRRPLALLSLLIGAATVQLSAAAFAKQSATPFVELSAAALAEPPATPFARHSAAALAQEKDENDPARAAALIRDAVKARGGDAYLRITSVISRGQFSQYDKGVSGDPVTFVDYIVYPAKERTEFGKGQNKFVQSNSDGVNWVYDANQRMIREQKDDQIKQFQLGQRYDLDHLLRLASRADSGLKLSFVGHREIWRNTFADSVRAEYGDGGYAILNFDPRSKLPVSIEYKTSTEQGPVSNEVRFFRWVEFGGVLFPTLQDFYRGGTQSSHVSFDEVSFNVAVPEKLFAKPLSIKEVK